MNKKRISEIVKSEFNKILNENINLNGKTIINVDIQPEYEDGIMFINDWVDFLNQNYENNNIVFLYNGADTLGMISEHEYIMWLFENGVEEEVLDNSEFYDKGYAFFRYCMDEGIEDDEIIDLVKYMNDNDINDSRMMDDDAWNEFMNRYNYDQSEVKDLLDVTNDAIHVPDLMDYLRDKNNIVLTGGGINECLKEVEIALGALDKNYQKLQQYVY